MTRLRQLRVAGVLLAVVALAVPARHVDWPAAWHSIRAVGNRAPLIALPYLLAVSCETLGWRASFEHARRLPFGLLWRLRLATNAVINSLPGGVALGEALKVVLLKRCLAIPLSEGLANVAIGKIALALGHVLFLVSAAALSSSDLAASSLALFGQRGLERWALWGALLVLLALVAIALAAQSGTLVRSLKRLQRVMGESWRSRLKRFEAPLARVDHDLAVARRVSPWQGIASVAFFFTCYVCVGFENWLILHWLNTDVSLSRGLALEAGASILRVLFFFIPSGLGAAELGYYALLKVYGVPNPEVTAAAFALLKRCKELAWIGLGYWVLAGLPARLQDVHRAERPAASVLPRPVHRQS